MSIITDLLGVRVRYYYSSEGTTGVVRAIFMDGDRPALWVENDENGKLDFVFAPDFVAIEKH